MRDPLVVPDDRGLWVRRGGFHVDPWRPVDLAIVTHAHSDHARPGSRRYLAAESCVPMLARRLPAGAEIIGVPFGERLTLGDATVSLHPAGHVRGSAQVRVEVDGEIWVASGDYKRASDPTSEPFEPVRCHTLITEATFALPVYRWRPGSEVAGEILAWWNGCVAEGRCAVLGCYALGKAQRLLAEIGRLTDRPVHLHGAIAGPTDAYRAQGVEMAETLAASEIGRSARGRAAGGERTELVLAPPSALSTNWMDRFGDASTAFASGWMQVRGVRRRRAVDRGFVLSDHADWPALVATIEECRCERVLTTHGYGDALVRYLRERGMDAGVLATEYGAEEDAGAEPAVDRAEEFGPSPASVTSADSSARVPGPLSETS